VTVPRPAEPAAGQGCRPEARSDAGATLIEVVAAMVITTVAGAIFTQGIVLLSRADSLTTALVDAQTQVARAFTRLDQDVRYAADLVVQALPASQSAAPSLIYLSTVDGARCHAVSLVGSRLQYQEWAPGASPGAATILASGVSAIPGVAPFTVTGGTGSSATPKEATVAVAASSGGPSASSRREMQETFLAPNTLLGPQGASLTDCGP
jgi:Tfp pilus assembly protein PilE